MAETDINKILVNGAQIALEQLKRARSHDSLMFHYAEISVYLEVSLSQGAGISHWSQEALQDMFAEAAQVLMERSRQLRVQPHVGA
ncbi:hypothetical protein [Balneatrix alpica]|uniref:Excinuclease ABC subunit C n=1 Tax=Balneatrix alpica TaxID=75684 RepID=A0ABV5Z6M8_9GAMM|nr:hypothetical protein [Balneatrix alpica]